MGRKVFNIVYYKRKMGHVNNQRPADPASTASIKKGKPEARDARCAEIRQNLPASPGSTSSGYRQLKIRPAAEALLPYYVKVASSANYLVLFRNG